MRTFESFPDVEEWIDVFAFDSVFEFPWLTTLGPFHYRSVEKPVSKLCC